MLKFLKKDPANKAPIDGKPSAAESGAVEPPGEAANEVAADRAVTSDAVLDSTANFVTDPAANDASSRLVPAEAEVENDAEQPTEALSGKLKKTRGGFGDRLKSLFGLRKQIDQDLLEEIETLLLTADVGADAALAISDALSKRVKRKELSDNDAVWQALRNELLEIIRPVEVPLRIDQTRQPFVLLVVGVNGVGKTTTIGKLARRFKADGHSVMLAAGDTFRAAAVEQLQTWGDRNDVPVIAQASGADSASVIFDAVQSARARGIDVLIADTAGRLHTQANLMDELIKIKRVMGKLDEQAPHEVMIVIDGGTGQNAISQAEQFNQAVGLTGLTVTKLDGTAKGGVLFALAKKLGVPIRFIGVGETATDLREFKAEEFVDAIIGNQR